MIKFNELQIERERWGENKGKLKGKLDIEGKNGSIKLILSDKLTESILQLARTALVDAVEETANGLIYEITTAIPETHMLTSSENTQ